jgi:hypothetical protein
MRLLLALTLTLLLLKHRSKRKASPRKYPFGRKRSNEGKFWMTGILKISVESLFILYFLEKILTVFLKHTKRRGLYGNTT